MSFNTRELELYRDKLLAFKENVPEIMNELVVGEGVYAVKQAKLIAKNDSPDIIDSGAYRNHWHAGDKALAHGGNKDHDGSTPKQSGGTYRIDVYNNSDYAKHLEYGFRAHWVPGKFEGKTFVYVRGYKPAKGDKDDPGGMYVGPKNGYVKGRFVMLRAIKRTKDTQQARLNRKFKRKLNQYLEGGGSGDGQ